MLLDSLRLKRFNQKYTLAQPRKTNRFSFRPEEVTRAYRSWPSVTEIALASPTNGLMEKRAGALIDIDRQALEERMTAYFSAAITWETLIARGHLLTQDAARYAAKQSRTKVLSRESYDPARIQRYGLRPFDSRWCYYSAVRPLWNEPRPSYWAQCWNGNSFFMTRFRSSAFPEGPPAYHLAGLSDDHFIIPDNACFPVLLRHGCEAPREEKNGQYVFEDVQPYCVTKANLSDQSRKYLQGLKVGDPDSGWETASLIWMHALAIGYSPAYLNDNADGIRQDWPRIPLPASKKGLLASAESGRRVAALLDTEKPVGGVTKGRLDPHLKGLCVISKVGGGALNPQAGELDLTAGWGHGGQGGVCMPGKGRCEIRHQASEALSKAFGDETLDVYLNDFAYWANVPKPVWEYVIGGYQVIKKWLSYREKCMLGRGLNLEEAEYVTDMIRRIAAILLLHPALDANYEAVKADTYSWPM